MKKSKNERINTIPFMQLKIHLSKQYYYTTHFTTQYHGFPWERNGSKRGKNQADKRGRVRINADTVYAPEDQLKKKLSVINTYKKIKIHSLILLF